MKYTGAGVLSAIAAGLLPFVTSNDLFYPAINSKFFFISIWVSVLVAIGAYQIWKGREAVSIKHRWLLGALGLVLVIQYVSGLLGTFPERSFWSDIFWSTGTFFLTYCAFLAVALGSLLNERDWSLLRRALTVSAGIFGFLSILGLNGFGFSGHFLWINLSEGSMTLGNETYAGAFLLLSLLLGLIELAKTPKGSIWRWVLIDAIALIVLSPLLLNIGLLFGKSEFTSVASLLGSSRASSATMFVLAGFLAGYGVIRRFAPEALRTKLTIGWGGGIVAVLAVGLVLLMTPGTPVQQAYINESTAARIIVWESSMAAFAERPVLGWGPENFSYAFQSNFDSRLFLKANFGEIWFERAHNVFIDTLVGSGVVGVASFALLIAAYIVTVYRARKRGLIGDTEAVLLYALVPVHLLHMQTGFDTVPTYTLLAVMGGYTLFLERSMSDAVDAPKTARQVLAGVLILLILIGGKFATDEFVRQSELYRTFRVSSGAEQRTAIAASLGRASSFESLRLSFASFVKGSLALIAEKPSPEKNKVVIEFLSIYEEYFKRHLSILPDDYRARINYAYLLLLKTGLGDNRLEDAKVLIRSSYELSPGNPLTYILDSTAELYSGNLKEADRLMQEALAINPDIRVTQEAATYLERQKASFPNISVLKFTNI